MAEETVVATPEQEMGKQLELFLTPEKKEGTAQTPASGTPPTAQSEPQTQAEPTLEEKLKTIEEPPAEKDGPKLSDEQERILSIIPNAKVAEQVQTLASGYQNFTSAFERGDFQGVEEMLSAWNPEATRAFEEHIYQKNVANGKWVDRWIAEKEGNAPFHAGIESLQQQVRALQSKLDWQEQSRNQSTRQQQFGQIAQNYDQHINSLFDKIEFSANDRKWVRAEIDRMVGGDQRVLSAINSGNMGALNPFFKTAVKEYVERDKAVAAGKDQQAAGQSLRKPLIQGSAINPTTPLSSDIKDVPKGREDDWMNQELEGLFASKGKKK